MTTKDDIRYWLDEAKRKGATHMIVVCDDYNYYDYPVHVDATQSASAVVADYNTRSMQRVMECYNLALDIEAQLNERRAFHV